MGILHIVRCDADDCETEAPIQCHNQHAWQVSIGGQLPPSSSIPTNWHKISGKTFCSWACVGAFATTQRKP